MEKFVTARAPLKAYSVPDVVSGHIGADTKGTGTNSVLITKDKSSSDKDEVLWGLIVNNCVGSVDVHVHITSPTQSNPNKHQFSLCKAGSSVKLGPGDHSSTDNLAGFNPRAGGLTLRPASVWGRPTVWYDVSDWKGPGMNEWVLVRDDKNICPAFVVSKVAWVRPGPKATEVNTTKVSGGTDLATYKDCMDLGPCKVSVLLAEEWRHEPQMAGHLENLSRVVIWINITANPDVVQQASKVSPLVVFTMHTKEAPPQHDKVPLRGTTPSKNRLSWHCGVDQLDSFVPSDTIQLKKVSLNIAVGPKSNLALVPMFQDVVSLLAAVPKGPGEVVSLDWKQDTPFDDLQEEVWLEISHWTSHNPIGFLLIIVTWICSDTEPRVTFHFTDQPSSFSDTADFIKINGRKIRLTSVKHVTIGLGRHVVNAVIA